MTAPSEEASAILKQCKEVKGSIEFIKSRHERILKGAQTAQLAEVAEQLGVEVTKQMAYDKSTLREAIIDFLAKMHEKDLLQQRIQSAERAEAKRAEAAAEKVRVAKAPAAAPEAAAPAPVSPAPSPGQLRRGERPTPELKLNLPPAENTSWFRPPSFRSSSPRVDKLRDEASISPSPRQNGNPSPRSSPLASPSSPASPRMGPDGQVITTGKSWQVRS